MLNQGVPLLVIVCGLNQFVLVSLSVGPLSWADMKSFSISSLWRRMVSSRMPSFDHLVAGGRRIATMLRWAGRVEAVGEVGKGAGRRLQRAAAARGV